MTGCYCCDAVTSGQIKRQCQCWKLNCTNKRYDEKIEKSICKANRYYYFIKFCFNLKTEEENCFERIMEIKVYQRYVLCLLMFTGLITNYVSYLTITSHRHCGSAMTDFLNKR